MLSASSGRRQPPGSRRGVADDKRHPQWLFVQLPAVAEAALAVVHAVIGSEDDDGVVGQRVALQGGDDTPDVAVHAADHAIQPLEVALVVRGAVEAGVPAHPALRLADEARQRGEERGIGVHRLGNDRILVEPVLGLGTDIVTRVAVLGVGGVEAYRQTEGAPCSRGRVPVDERHGVVAGDVGEMAYPAVGLANLVSLVVPVLVVVEVIEHSLQAAGILQRRLDAVHSYTELADEAGVVAGRLQQRRVADVAELPAQRRGEEGELVAALVQPGEVAGPAGGTHRGGGEGVGEAHPAVPQQVEVRGMDDAVAGAAHQVGALVVGEQKDDVGATHSRNPRVVHRARPVEPAAGATPIVRVIVAPPSPRCALQLRLMVTALKCVYPETVRYFSPAWP